MCPRMKKLFRRWRMTGSRIDVISRRFVIEYHRR
jgi:hypothetical protein